MKISSICQRFLAIKALKELTSLYILNIEHVCVVFWARPQIMVYKTCSLTHILPFISACGAGVEIQLQFGAIETIRKRLAVAVSLAWCARAIIFVIVASGVRPAYPLQAAKQSTYSVCAQAGAKNCRGEHIFCRGLAELICAMCKSTRFNRI